MGEDIIYYTKKDSLESEEREIIIYCNRDGKVWWDPVTNPFSSMSINPSVGINNSGKKVIKAHFSDGSLNPSYYTLE